MGYVKKPVPDTGKLVREAGSVLSHAQKTRAEHRRRDRLDRDDELASAILKINKVQQKLRSVIAQAIYQYVEHEDELRSLSDQLQRERRKLRKMLDRSRR